MDQHRLTLAVCSACRSDDIALLRCLLAPGVTAVIDTGGASWIDPASICGVDEVSRTLRGFFGPGLDPAEHSVNGGTGVVVRRRHQVVAVLVLDVAGGLVQQVWAVLNPDKLSRWNQP